MALQTVNLKRHPAMTKVPSCGQAQLVNKQHPADLGITVTCSSTHTPREDIRKPLA